MRHTGENARTCSACGSELSTTAQYCGECGATTPEKKQLRAASHRADRATVAALAMAFVGTLGTLLATYALYEAGFSDGLLTVASNLLFVGVGLAAVHFLGKGALRASFARQPDEHGILLGLLAIPLCLAVNLTYVALLGSSDASVESTPDSPLFLILTIAVMPALIEEWLDRGVIWTACMRATTEGRTILLTAGLFALSHGLNGGVIYELPHRFIMGLILGWLRARTGSLLPGMLAHFGNNLVAVTLL